MSVNSSKYPATLTFEVSSSDTSGYEITFDFLGDASNLSAWYRDGEGKKQELTLDVDWAIDILDGSDGIFGIISLAPRLDEGTAFTVERNIPNSQDKTFSSQTIFSTPLETALDKTTLLFQDYNFKDSCIRAPDDETVSKDKFELAGKAERVNTLLCFDEEGDLALVDKIRSGAGFPATYGTLGLVMIGDTLDITADGILDAQYANTERAGIVQIGGGLTIDEDGTLSTNIATDISAINQLAEEANEISEDVSTRITELASNISTLQSDLGITSPKVADIESDVETLQTAMSTAQSDISTLQSEMSTAQSDISSLQTNMAAVQGDIETLQTDITTAQSDITTLQSDMTTAQSDISTLQSDMSTVQSTISTLPTSMSTVQSDISTLQSDVYDLENGTGFSDTQTAADQAISDSSEAMNLISGLEAEAEDAANDAVVIVNTDIEWGYSTLPTTGDWYNAAFGEASDFSRFVVITGGDTGYATAYSASGGRSWSSGGAVSNGGEWRGLAFDSYYGRFVTVDHTGDYVARSNDGGETWTETSGMGYYDWNNVAYGDRYYVAVPYNSAASRRSVDGITWSSGGRLPRSALWRGLAYGAGNFVAIADSGGYAAYSSNQARSWTSATLPYSDSSNNKNWRGLAYGARRFVTVSKGGQRTAYSEDGGATWQNGGNLPASANWINVAYGDGYFVAIARDSADAAYSTNGGDTWTAINFSSTFGAKTKYAIASGGAYFVVPAYDDNAVAYLRPRTGNLTVKEAVQRLLVVS